MEPITILIAAAASLCAGALGYTWGQRASSASPAPAPSPQPAASRPAHVAARQHELEQENAALKQLLELPDRASPALSSPLLGAASDELHALLAEVIAQRPVRGALFMDAEGLALTRASVEHAEQVLGALWAGVHSALSASEPVRAVCWRDELGNTLEITRVARAVGDPLQLGVWSQGSSPSTASIARVRYVLGGLKLAESTTAPPAPLRRGHGVEGLPDVIERIIDHAEVSRLALWSDDEARFDVSTERSAMDDVTLRALWRVAQRFGQTREALGLGEVASLQITTARGRVHTLYPVRAAVGAAHVFLITHDARRAHPHERMSAWLGQLAWQLPPAEADRPAESPSRTPEQHVGRQAS